MMSDLPETDAAAPTSPPSASGRAQTVVRRVIVYVVLFALVVIAAIGLSGLLERVLGAGTVIADDALGLARSLAFALIATPLAALLWWWQARRLRAATERASLVWALYLTAMSLTALVTASMSLATAAAAGIGGAWRPDALATGIVWAGVWVWQRMLLRSRSLAPTRLTTVPDALATVYGLAVGATGAVWALAALLGVAFDGAQLLAVSRSWAVPALQALVWAVIGAVVWWWHWYRGRSKDATGAFASVVLVVIVGAAAAVTLFATGSALRVVLQLAFGTRPFAELLPSFALPLAAALVVGAVWAYHAQRLAERAATVRRAARLVVSGVALIGAASGFGVVINAALATATPSLADDDPVGLLLGGISALVVAGPVWWAAWRPTATVTQDDAGDTARRVYLVVVFGASAIVAIGAVLTIGYRLFEAAFASDAAGGLLERTRAPLGVLCATALVFAYHFWIWRRDRGTAPATSRHPSVGRVVLVAGGDAQGLADAIRAELGSAVTVWRTADEQAAVTAEAIPGVIETLRALEAPRALVIAEGAAARVVPLAD